MSIDTFWEGFALTVTSLFAIRETIAKNVEIPKKILPEKWRWILYNKKDEKPVLCRRAYSLEKKFTIEDSVHSISEQLLQLASRHIKYYEHGLVHGRSAGTKKTSDYFINTLEASYIDADLATMTLAIRKLIVNQSLTTKIDFVLCLKSGNQILARNIYKDHPDIIYICRHDESSGYYPMKENVATDKYSTQYENLDTLLTAADRARHEKLNGIVIDCSVSSGAGLKKSIEHFNKLISNQNLNINPIEHAFVLCGHQKINDSQYSFKLHRYFDMTEKVRELIYDKRNKDPLWYKEVYEYIKNNGLLKEQPE